MKGYDLLLFYFVIAVISATVAGFWSHLVTVH